MRLRQRPGLLAGTAVLAAAGVMLAVALGRVATAQFGHAVALTIVPLALLGLGEGGVLLSLAPGLARPPGLLPRLAHLAALVSAAAVAAVLVVLHVKAPDGLDRAALGRAVALAIAATMPFVFVGVALAAALRYAARDVGRVGLALFAGAAAGGPLAAAALPAGALRVVLVAAILSALGSLVFYLAAPAPSAPGPSAAVAPRARGGVVATAVLATIVLLAGDMGAPWMKTPALRWTALDKTEAQQWTVLGLETVDKPAAGSAWLRTDGTAGSPILEGKNAIAIQPDEMVYTLHREPGPVLVLSAGGGRDARVAMKYGQKDVHAVERSGAAVRAFLRDRYKKWSGDLVDKAELTIAVDDPRDFVRRTKLRFRVIVIPLDDTQVPEAVGAYAAAVDDLRTVEALGDAFDRLTPDGALVVSAWDGEVYRLFEAAGATLRRAGVADPAPHVYACGAGHATSLLLSRAALSARDLGALHAHCRKNKLNEAFTPDQPKDEIVRLLGADPGVAAPTDDRPFIFQGVLPRALGATLRSLSGLVQKQQALLALLVSLSLSGAALGLALGFPPLYVPISRRAPAVFFAASGAGLSLAAAALALRVPVLLGHPGHALTTVLVTLFAFAGAGSLLGRRPPAALVEAAAGYRAQILVLGMAAASVLLGPLCEQAFGLPFPARLALSVIVIAPVGVLAGALFLLGIRTLRRTPALVPWCVGLFGLAAAFAAAFGALVATELGASAVLLAAGLAWLVAAASVPRRARRASAPATSGR